jgi:Susd and RagB outer membrane lipoprotein/CarboxypepD_reg-like domain
MKQPTIFRPTGVFFLAGLLFCLNLQAQIKGQISDAADKQPVSGASIAVAKSSKATTTDLQGNFSIDAKKGDKITVSFIGYQTDKLSKIALQEWIALYFNGLEAWFDWRRTGMPEIVPGASNLNGNKVPVRYIYPLSEQSLNGTNRQKAVTTQGGTDDLNTKMWLLK